MGAGIPGSGYRLPLCPSEKLFLFCDYSIADITENVNSFFEIIYRNVILYEHTWMNLCKIYKDCIGTVEDACLSMYHEACQDEKTAADMHPAAVKGQYLI